MRFILAVAFSMMACFATAQEFPAQYHVTGVHSEDTLNVRMAPDPSTEIIGELAPFDRDIEVLQLSANGQWGKIAGGESNGWVSMRYMRRAEPELAAQMPRPMTCLGTEPFWTLTIKEDGTVFEEFGMDSYNLSTLNESVSEDGRDYFGTYSEEDTSAHTVIIQRRICGDGLTDRDYGFRAMLFTDSPRGNSAKSGCCTLDGR